MMQSVMTCFVLSSKLDLGTRDAERQREIKNVQAPEREGRKCLAFSE